MRTWRRDSHLERNVCTVKNQMWKKVSGEKLEKRLVGKNVASRKMSTNEKLRNVTVKNRSPKSEFWPVVNFGEKWNVTIGKILVEWWEKIIFVHTLG